MINTLGLWIVLICSLLVLILMLLYTYGVLAKCTKPIVEKIKALKKEKENKKKEKQKRLKEKCEKRKQVPQEIESLDFKELDSIGEMQSEFWEKKNKKAKKKIEGKESSGEEDETRRISFVTKFHKCLFAVFLAAAILFFPYYWDYFDADFLVVRGLKTFFMAVHNTVRLFILDGDFGPIQEVLYPIKPMETTAWLTAVRCVYGLYATVLYLVAPLMTAGFVLSLFKGITAYLKYQFLSKADEVYLISELNERSIELAKDILNGKRIATASESCGEKKGKKRFRKQRIIIVFAEVFAKNEEKSFELISQAKNLGAYCFKRDVADLGLKRCGIHNETIQKVYFISEDEDENVEQALIMIEACRKKEKFNTANTSFYIFATTPESEVLLDFVDNGNMKIRRVNENKDLAIATLRESNIFSRAIECKHGHDKIFLDKDGKEEKTIFDRENLKLLRVLIVGLGNYGTELLKTLCWSSQMFNYVLEVYVFDKNGEAEGKMSRVAPDLLSYSGEGDGLTRPYYKIKFAGDADVTTGEFYQKLAAEIPGAVTTVFVMLGEDELNIQTAMGLRSYFGQKVQLDAQTKENLKKEQKEKEISEREWQESIPQIFSTVYSEIKNRIFDRNEGLQNNENKNYGITFIGNMTKRYSLAFIEQKELVAAGERVHCRYCGMLDKNDMQELVAEMKDLLAKENQQQIKDYLQARANVYANKVKALTQGISQQAERLLEGKDAQTKEAWATDIANNTTGAIEKEMAKLKEELDAAPQEILKQARLEECENLVDAIDRKVKLTAVYDSFSNILQEDVGIEQQKEFLKWLIELSRRQIKWLDAQVEQGKKDYDRYEYFRSSSIATAIHEEFRGKLYTDEAYEPFLQELKEYRNATVEERAKMRENCIEKVDGNLEHLRWQAYMWAEGYKKGLYKSSIDKTHHKLVATNQRIDLDREKSEKLARHSKGNASIDKTKEKK